MIGNFQHRDWQLKPRLLSTFGAILLALMLAGCGFTPQGNLIREVVKQSTQKAGDVGLQNAIWFLCEAAPVGSVKRRYGGDKADAYNRLCDRGSAENIIAPDEPPD